MVSPPMILIISFIFYSTLFHSSLADIPGCDPNDQAVLLQIKAKIKSPNPGIGDLSDWDPNTNCCYWDFIGCNGAPGPSYGRVDGVTISRGSGLVGQIPEELGNLPYLTEIMFMDEPKLTGPLPSSLSELKRLEVIYLGSNSLSGPVPAYLGKLTKLREIDISGNHFTGSLPASLSKLGRLNSFNVSHNKLSGSIPNLKTSNLKSFDVSYNQLCGAIPSGLGKFSKVYFSHNKCLCDPPLAPCNKLQSGVMMNIIANAVESGIS